MTLARLAAVAALALAVAACSDDDEPTGTQTPSAAGTYSLTSITQGTTTCQLASAQSGCTINNTGTNTVAVTSGTLVLQTTGNFSLTAAGTQNGTSQPFAPVSGTYTQSGTTVTFTVPGVPVPLAATFNSASNTLSTSVPGQIFGSTQAAIAAVFTRQ